MKRILLAAGIGLGIFTVATSSANNHVSTYGTKFSVSDTIRPDTIKKPDSPMVKINMIP